MTRIAAICLLASGCFYTDPINQRPSLDIEQVSSAEVYRGDGVELKAVANDPEGQAVAFAWRIYLCTDATQSGQCDEAPYTTGTESTEFFVVPSVREDVAVPVLSVLVELRGTDALGATAKPIQQLIIPIADHPPDLDLRKDSRHGYVIGTPIDVFAKVGDSDDGPAAVTVNWSVFSPATQPAFGFDDLTVAPDPMDPDHVQFGKVFTPMGIGDWDIQVSATDPLAATTVQHLPVTVVADHPPCLAQWAPIAPTDPGQTLPISDPTLFQILVVEDDLDVFPPVPSDPVLGVATFSWSLLPPGGTTREVLTGVTGNRVSIDPATYDPGDVIELRVEIQDRNHTPINCADSDPTCSVVSDPSCIQRLTWQVEAL